MSLTRLTPDAVPTIFPNSPAYLPDCGPVREKPEAKRKRVEATRLQEAIQLSLSAHKEEEQKNRVSSYDQFLSRLPDLHVADFWLIQKAKSAVLFVHIDDSMGHPEVEHSVVVTDTMKCWDIEQPSPTDLKQAWGHLRTTQVYEPKMLQELCHVHAMPEVQVDDKVLEDIRSDLLSCATESALALHLKGRKISEVSNHGKSPEGSSGAGGREPDMKITLLMAVQFIFGAWCGVRASTVQNCFREAGFVRRCHTSEAGEEEEMPVEACEAPDDEGVPELWSALNEDASGLDDSLHADDIVETSECLSDEAIVARVRSADSGDSDDSDDAVEEPTQCRNGLHLDNPLHLQLKDRLNLNSHLRLQVITSSAMNMTPVPLLCKEPGVAEGWCVPGG
ncbi:hypothetical protein ISCGN_002528 [Ixodes scapularis]